MAQAAGRRTGELRGIVVVAVLYDQRHGNVAAREGRVCDGRDRETTRRYEHVGFESSEVDT